jgi:hypothetical protein
MAGLTVRSDRLEGEAAKSIVTSVLAGVVVDLER